MSSITDLTVAKTLRGCSQLSQLNLSGLPTLTDPTLQHLRDYYARTLTSLSIAGAGVTGREIGRLLRDVPGLVSLDMSHTRGTGPTLHTVFQRSKCDSLRVLDASHSPLVTDAFARDLAASARGSLTSVTLRACGSLTDAGLAHLAASCPALRHVDVSLCGEVTDAGIRDLAAGCHVLETVRLAGCPAVTETAVFQLAAGAGRTITELDVSSTAVGDLVSEALAAIPGLRKLRMRACGHLRRVEVALDALEVLDVAGSSRMTSLRFAVAGVAGPTLRAASLDASMCQALETVVVSGATVRSVDVSSCPALCELVLRTASLRVLRAVQCPSLAGGAGAQGGGVRFSSGTVIVQHHRLRALHISGCVALTSLLVRAAPCLRRLDATGAHGLQQVMVDGAPRLTTVMLDRCPRLSTVSLGGSGGEFDDDPDESPLHSSTGGPPPPPPGQGGGKSSNLGDGRRLHSGHRHHRRRGRRSRRGGHRGAHPLSTLALAGSISITTLALSSPFPALRSLTIGCGVVAECIVESLGNCAGIEALCFEGPAGPATAIPGSSRRRGTLDSLPAAGEGVSDEAFCRAILGLGEFV
jgi:hypothetical protein